MPPKRMVKSLQVHHGKPVGPQADGLETPARMAPVVGPVLIIKHGRVVLRAFLQAGGQVRVPGLRMRGLVAPGGVAPLRLVGGELLLLGLLPHGAIVVLMLVGVVQLLVGTCNFVIAFV